MPQWRVLKAFATLLHRDPRTIPMHRENIPQKTGREERQPAYFAGI